MQTRNHDLPPCGNRPQPLSDSTRELMRNYFNSRPRNLKKFCSNEPLPPNLPRLLIS